jgi:hypothetical protein
MPSGFYNGSIMFADNVRFDGAEQPGQVTTDGQLLIGSTTAPNIRVGILATPNAGSSVEFNYSTPNINLDVTDASGNTIIGNNAGNGTLTATYATGVGGFALNALTSATLTTSTGFFCLGRLQNGDSNAAYGSYCMQYLVSGSNNAAFGDQCLNLCTGSNNTAFGSKSLSNYTGDNNTAFGYLSCRDTTTSGNTGIGFLALVNGGGANNTGVGYQALTNLGTGTGNTTLGYNSGVSLTLTDSGNLLLDNTGTVGDNTTIRIGTNQTKCFIKGISGVTVAASAPVLIDAAGQLGTILSSERYKENIKDMPENLSVLDLRPVQFNYKSDENKSINYGLIAEEVAKDFPYLCIHKDGQPETVKYHELCVFLLAEIQRLETRVTMLEVK